VNIGGFETGWDGNDIILKDDLRKRFL
jgi:hypothetical protein